MYAAPIDSPHAVFPTGKLNTHLKQTHEIATSLQAEAP